MPADRSKDKMVRGGTRPLAASVGDLSKSVLGKRGFAEAGLVTGWENIVGAELAESCWPDRLSFPAGRRDGATLRIRVSGGLSLELQHMEPQLLERINGHFGYRAVERIAIIHAPPDRRPSLRKPVSPKPQGPVRAEDRARVAAALDQVEDPEIRAALARLGRAMISDGQEGGEK